jgi:hypothetical protein
MPYLFINVWFPPQKGEEMGKKALEVFQKFPEDTSIAKTAIQGALMRTKNGIKGVTVFEVNEGKLEAAIDRAQEIVDTYSDVEGVNARFDLYATLAESMEMIGLKMP